MTVKELISVLQTQHENTEVRICVVDDNDACWDIVKVFGDGITDTVWIDCGWKESK